MAILAVSCKKSNNPPPPHQNTFTASVNGTAFVPTNIKVLINSATVPSATGILIKADNVNGQFMALLLGDYNGAKSTFNFDQSGQNSVYFCTQSCDSFFPTESVSSGGQFKIDSFDKRTYKDGEVITGTFQFDVTGDAGPNSITNGHFSLFVPK
jgi:hypothetical protein